MKILNRFRNPEWLRARYWDDELTLEQIADEAGCTADGIRYWMGKHSIKRRPRTLSRKANNAKTGLIYRDEAWLRARYLEDEWSMEAMAEVAGCSPATIYYWMQAHGIERRRSHPQLRKDGCAICGIPLPSYRRRYCSDSCSEIGHRQLDRAREKRLKSASDTECEYCGQPLSVLQEKRGYRFCTVQCWAMSKATLKGTVRTCMICGKEFEPHYKEQLCCDKSCGNIRGRRTEKERGYEQEQISCVRCSKDFSAPRYTGAVKWTMCPRCRREWDRDRCRRKRVAVDAAVEEIIDYVVFERDSWTCQLCSEAVDPKCEWPDSMSPSIDHIMPLSKGGDHSMDNVQLAHLGCNCRKNNNVESCDEGQKAETELLEKA